MENCIDNNDDKIIIYATKLKNYPYRIDDLIFVDFHIGGKYSSCLRSSWDSRNGGVGAGLPGFTPFGSVPTATKEERTAGCSSSSTYNNDNYTNDNNIPFPSERIVNPLSTHLCVIAGDEIHCIGTTKVCDIVCGDEHTLTNKLYNLTDMQSNSQRNESEYIGIYNYRNNSSAYEESAILLLRNGKLYASILHPNENNDNKIVLSESYLLTTDFYPYILGCKIISQITINDSAVNSSGNCDKRDNSDDINNYDDNNKNNGNGIQNILQNDVKFILKYLNCSTGMDDTVTLCNPQHLNGDKRNVLSILRTIFGYSIEKKDQNNGENNIINNTSDKAIQEIISAIDEAVSAERYMKNKIKVIDVETLQMVALLNLLDENYSPSKRLINLDLSVDLKNNNSSLSKYIKVERTLRSELGSSGTQIGGMVTYLDFNIICLSKVSMRALQGRCVTIACTCTGPQSPIHNAVTTYSRDLQFSITTINNKDSYSCSLSVPIEISRISTYKISLSIHISYLTPELELYSQTECAGNQPMFVGLGLNPFDLSSACGKIIEMYESVLTLEEVYTVLNNESMSIQNAFVSTVQSVVRSPSVKVLNLKQGILNRKKVTSNGYGSDVKSNNSDKGVGSDRKNTNNDNNMHGKVGMKNEEYIISLSIPYLHSQQYNQKHSDLIDNEINDSSIYNQKESSYKMNDDNNNAINNTNNHDEKNMVLNSDKKMSSMISTSMRIIQTNIKSANDLSYHNKYTSMNTPKGFLGHLHPISNSNTNNTNSKDIPFYLSVNMNTVTCVGIKNHKNNLGNNNHASELDMDVLEMTGSPSLLSSISSVATKKALDYLNANNTCDNDNDHKSNSIVGNLIHSTIFSEKDVYSLPYNLQKVMVASSILVKELNVKMTKNKFNPNHNYDDTDVLDGGLDYVRTQTMKLWELYHIMRSTGC
jgi:hypothetical protein